jgi:hypothetical protein
MEYVGFDRKMALKSSSKRRRLLTVDHYRKIMMLEAGKG